MFVHQPDDRCGEGASVLGIGEARPGDQGDGLADVPQSLVDKEAQAVDPGRLSLSYDDHSPKQKITRSTEAKP